MLETKFNRPEEGLRIHDGSRVAGYASIFGERDQGGDTVMPGAYAASLARLAAAGGRVRMLWQHDATQPIGVWDEVREDGRGLWVEGRLADRSDPRARSRRIDGGRRRRWPVDRLPDRQIREIARRRAEAAGTGTLGGIAGDLSHALGRPRGGKGASVADEIAVAMAVLAQGIDSARAALRNEPMRGLRAGFGPRLGLAVAGRLDPMAGRFRLKDW
jgi:hypothetical protein